jgi:hypothetical protein
MRIGQEWTDKYRESRGEEVKKRKEKKAKEKKIIVDKELTL